MHKSCKDGHLLSCIWAYHPISRVITPVNPFLRPFRGVITSNPFITGRDSLCTPHVFVFPDIRKVLARLND